MEGGTEGCSRRRGCPTPRVDAQPYARPTRRDLRAPGADGKVTIARSPLCAAGAEVGMEPDAFLDHCEDGRPQACAGWRRCLFTERRVLGTGCGVWGFPEEETSGTSAPAWAAFAESRMLPGPPTTRLRLRVFRWPTPPLAGGVRRDPQKDRRRADSTASSRSLYPDEFKSRLHSSRRLRPLGG